MVAEALLDLGDAVRGDPTEQHVLARRDPDVRHRAVGGELAQDRAQAHAVAVGDLARRDGQADDAVARAVVLVGDPRRQLDEVAEPFAEPALDLAAEPLDAALVDEVLEAGPVAVLAVAEVALHGDDRLGDVDDPLRAGPTPAATRGGDRCRPGGRGSGRGRRRRRRRSR